MSRLALRPTSTHLPDWPSKRPHFWPVILSPSIQWGWFALSRWLPGQLAAGRLAAATRSGQVWKLIRPQRREPGLICWRSSSLRQWGCCCCHWSSGQGGKKQKRTKLRFSSCAPLPFPSVSSIWVSATGRHPPHRLRRLRRPAPWRLALSHASRLPAISHPPRPDPRKKALDGWFSPRPPGPTRYTNPTRPRHSHCRGQ